MPIIQIHILEGRTVQQKRALVAGVTEAVTAALAVKPEQVRILLDEIPPGHFAIAGQTAADKLEAQQQASAANT